MKQPSQVLAQLEDAAALDAAAAPLRDLVAKLPQAAQDLLHGVLLGHPLHPAAVQAPVGAFLSAGVLDAWPGRGNDGATEALILTGLVTSLPAATSGLVDWSKSSPEQQRVGLVHAACNVTALGFYVASLRARRRGHRMRGRMLGWIGLSTAGAGAFIGGHLAYHQAIGANHAASVRDLVAPGWHDAAGVDELPQGQPVEVMVSDVPVMVVRQGSAVYALADRCSHLAGPLHEGTILTNEGAGACVRCPWHGSTFRLSDGAVVHGPATAAQPVFDVSTEEGRVRVRLRQG
jgi:nitrite reductase/ring-hydroxylating ferredoxin subunit